MKPIEGAIYCQACVGRVSRRLRWAPEGFILRYPASHIGRGTCRRCGKDVWLVWASIVVKKEEKCVSLEPSRM